MDELFILQYPHGVPDRVLIRRVLSLDEHKQKKDTDSMEIDIVLRDLISSLKPSDPYKIVLFGSYAKGTATADSDIDLMVILDNDKVAKTWTERSMKKADIRKLVREINYKYAMDILVYSRAEFKMVKELGNPFIDEVEETGRIIYEKAG
ncbi:nucleotidyltransferase domain-containing protein [Breznakiellaceae bacterium SP9]